MSQGEGVFGGLFAHLTAVVPIAELKPSWIGDPVPRGFVSCAQPEAKANPLVRPRVARDNPRFQSLLVAAKDSVAFPRRGRR